MKKDRFQLKQDRLLVGILLGILGLVVLALVIFFLRPDSQQYGTDDTPAGVTRNYILALQKGDYERAYSYFDTDGTPIDLDEFQNELLPRQPEIERVSVQVGNTEQTGEKALVSLILLHPANGPFGDTWRENSSAILVQNPAGEWKIFNSPYTFWGANWYPVKPLAP